MSNIQKKKKKRATGLKAGSVLIVIVVATICLLSGFGTEEAGKVVEKANEVKRIISEYTPFATEENKYSEYIVCIDPGHGGKDPGSMSKTHIEKEDNLNIALKVKENLEEYGVKIIMTREADDEQSLKRRAKIANKAEADLFISLHRNYIEGYKEINGIDIYIDTNASDDDWNFGNSIYNKLSEVNAMKVNEPKRGSATDVNENWTVVDETKMTACLIEMGYMSNKKDNKHFEKYVDEYAKAIADGVIEHLSKQEEEKATLSN